MSRTFKASKEFLLTRLYHQPAWSKKFTEMDKRLPTQVELTEEFVSQHALDFMWVEGIKLLLEGEHQRRAFAREVEAAKALNNALAGRDQSFPEGTRANNVVAYETTGDSAFDKYDKAVALAFAQELKAQGGVEVGRLTS